MSEHSNNAQAVIDTAIRATRPVALDETKRFHTVVSPDGEVKVIDLETYRTDLLDRPRRKTGIVAVHDAESFAAYFNKHVDDSSEVWADFPNTKITGLLNPHTSDAEAGHADHRVAYAVRHTPAWIAWANCDGTFRSQQQFAEHIEDRAIDIVNPSAADMLELAQTFQATMGVEFKSSKRLSSGEAQLEYRETVDASAGKAGRLDIPEKFELALVPFYGADPYKVIVRLRYRIEGGNLRLAYKIERPDEILQDAFGNVVDKVDQLVVPAVWNGTR